MSAVRGFGEFESGGGRRFLPLRAGPLLLALLWAPAWASAAGVYSDAQVKAEVLERVTRFVEWPEDAFDGPEAPFVIGVLGKNPFDRYLAEIAKTRRIKKRKVELVELDALDEPSRYHLLFISGNETSRLDKMLARTSGKPVLTVGDRAGFGKRGVLVNLVRSRGNIRFEVNLSAVRRSGLRFSARLLEVAKTIDEDEMPKKPGKSKEKTHGGTEGGR